MSRRQALNKGECAAGSVSPREKVPVRRRRTARMTSRRPGSPEESPQMAPPDFRRVRAIVFDLDGTLIDSYEAITESLNHAMSAAGLAPLPAEQVRGMVGMGLETLLARAMGEARVEEGVKAFRAHYDKICVQKTSLMPEVAETLAELHRRGYRM